METAQLSDDVVLKGIVDKLLSRESRRAIVACARRDLGAARNKKGIRQVARKHGADVRVVLAAFLFLPVLGNSRVYVDVTDTDEDAIETASLPDDRETGAAFALGRLALRHDELCPVAY